MRSGLAIVRAVRSGELRAEQALDDCIARIAATDARVNAFTDRTFERARREAQAIDAKRARGEPLPALAGLPYAVKNLFDIEGVTTRAGSKVRVGSLRRWPMRCSCSACAMPARCCSAG